MAAVMFKKRLGRLDHGPTKGGKAETTDYPTQYGKTLELREYFFGPAPTDIWEPVASRFDPVHFCLHHVDLRRLANYRIAVEMARARIDPSLLPEKTNDEQAGSILRLGSPGQSSKEFFTHQPQIQKAYTN